MERFGITTPNRIAFFLANVAEETGQFQAKQENLNYSAERLIAVFPSLFSRDPQRAHELAKQGPEAIGNYIYADAQRPPGYRMGNVEIGDGWKYRGRGPMQITGKNNYRQFFRAIGLPDDSDPDLLLQPSYGALSAAEYWGRMGCNELADLGEFEQCVVRVNGGTTGLASRSAYLRRLREALAHPDPVQSIARPASLSTMQEVEGTAPPGPYVSLNRLDAEYAPVPRLNGELPLGYEVTDSGNVVRSDLSESAILRSARVGQRIAWGTGIVTGIMTGLQALKEAFVSMLSGFGPIVLLVLSGIALTLAVAALLYFRGIEKRRIEMHEKGIA
jgi:putative chitinase